MLGRFKPVNFVRPIYFAAAMALLAVPVKAQDLSAFDPSECVIDPVGHVYFSLYGWVFAIDRDQNFEFDLDVRLEHPDAFQQQLRDRGHPTTERWPAPLNTDVPMGCPGNPIMTWKLTLEPTFEQLGVPPQTRRHPVSEEELSELTDEVRNRDSFRIRPTRYSLTALSTRPLTEVYQPVVDAIEQFCGAASTRVARYLDDCYLHGDNNRYFENLERQYSTKFFADTEFYTSPNGSYFSADCRYRAIQREFTRLRCEAGYKINQNIGLSYRFFTRTYPIHLLIPLDSAIRAYIANMFRPELSRPFAGTADDLHLPTIDHLTLIDQ